MFKLIICELLKLYKKPVLNHVSDYLYVLFGIASLIVLIVSNYLYQEGQYRYMSALLISSAILLAIGLIVKIVIMYRNRARVQRKDNDLLMNTLIELVPFVIRALPVGMLTLLVWSVSRQIKGRYLGDLRQSLKK